MTVPGFGKFLNHWIYLVQAVHILLQDEIKVEDLQLADKLLQKFVRGAELLYGEFAITSNVHSLLHTVQSVIDWGPLWAHSGYPFENSNGNIKDMLHASKGSISQICRRIKMKEAIVLIKRKVKFLYDGVERTFNSILNRNTVKTIKAGANRYFGKKMPITDDLARVLMLDPKAVAFHKMMKNNCIFSSAHKTNLRTDGSFAVTNDGHFNL